jgi:hypothetical protein
MVLEWCLNGAWIVFGLCLDGAEGYSGWDTRI